MQVNCPNCGSAISSEHINIQQMAAVCPACDIVFQFEIPEAKVKRRKVKQPERIALRESDDQLHMAFRTNFKLEKNENFLASAIMAATFGLMTLVLTPALLAAGKAVFLPAAFAITSLVLLYYTALIAFNKTHIDIQDETLRVSRQPLPAPFAQAHEIKLSAVTVIRQEETPVSKKEGYDTPRYRVWAEMEDRSQKLIVNDVIDDYALFIVQTLNEYLTQASDTAMARLVDGSPALDSDPALDEFAQDSTTDAR